MFMQIRSLGSLFQKTCTYIYFRRPPFWKSGWFARINQVYIAWKISIIIKLVRMKQRKLSCVQIHRNWYMGLFKFLFRGEFPNMYAKIFSLSAILKIGTIRKNKSQVNQGYIASKISIIVKLVRIKQRKLSYVQIHRNWYVG